MIDPDQATDEVTGLPPLEELILSDTMLVVSYNVSVGLARLPSGGVEEIRYLHLRGIAPNEEAPEEAVEWAQCHIAIPTRVVMELAADLVRGTTQRLDE